MLKSKLQKTKILKSLLSGRTVFLQGVPDTGQRVTCSKCEIESVGSVCLACPAIVNNPPTPSSNPPTFNPPTSVANIQRPESPELFATELYPSEGTGEHPGALEAINCIQSEANIQRPESSELFAAELSPSEGDAGEHADAVEPINFIEIMMLLDHNIMQNLKLTLDYKKTAYRTFSNYMYSWHNSLFKCSATGITENQNDINCDRGSPLRQLQPQEPSSTLQNKIEKRFADLSEQDQHTQLIKAAETSNHTNHLQRFFTIPLNSNTSDQPINNESNDIEALACNDADVVANHQSTSQLPPNPNVPSISQQIQVYVTDVVDQPPLLTRNFICDICGKVMTRAFLLSQHRLIHDPPVRCDKCGKSLSKRSMLTHLVKCDGITVSNRLTCSSCGKSFKSKRTLRNHLKLHKMS